VHAFQFQTLQWQNLTAFVNVNRDEIDELFHALSLFQFCLHNPFSGTAADGQSAHSSFKGGESGADFSTLGSFSSPATPAAHLPTVGTTGQKKTLPLEDSFTPDTMNSSNACMWSLLLVSAVIE
jgi:hypothetical protein